MRSGSRISGPALAALLPDVSGVAGIRYGVLHAAIAALILDGRVAVGVKLPSERELAEAVGVSRSTVTAAYKGLREQGYLHSLTGSGSFTAVPPETDTGLGRGRGRRHGSSEPRDWFSGERDQVAIDLTLAALPAPGAELDRALQSAAAELPRHAAGRGYAPCGLPELRSAVADHFKRRGVPTAPEQILVTNGAMHALDLLLRLLLEPGDRVLTELPTYPGALDAIRTSVGRLLPVPLSVHGGWDVAQMAASLRQSAPKLAYLIPDFHNPTGALIGEDAREAVLDVAREARTTVISDETFAGLGFTGEATPMAALDDSVVTLGSLSKSVWGGLRIGWIRADAGTVQRLAALRASVDVSSPVLDQLVAAALMPRLDDILVARRQELMHKHDLLLRHLRERLPQWEFEEPQGGLSLWIDLGAPVATPLTLLARSAGVLLVPGPRFGSDGTLERFMRIPFSASPEILRRAVIRLSAAWRGLDHGAEIDQTLLIV